MANQNDDLIDNPSSRCACMLMLDISGSMSGQPIHELNDGVSQFIDEVRDDEMAAVSVELGIVTAGGTAQEIARGAFYRLNNSVRYLDAALAHMKYMNNHE